MRTGVNQRGLVSNLPSILRLVARQSLICTFLKFQIGVIIDTVQPCGNTKGIMQVPTIV